MTSKKKNDNKNLLRRNGLVLSIGLNIILIAMFLVLYLPTFISPPPPTPDRFQLTATQLIITATEGRLVELGITATPSPTFDPIPTLSAEDEIALRERFLNELETELGFLHPVLEEKVDWFIRSIGYDIEYYNENHFGYTTIPDSIIRDMDRTTFDEVEYVAVVIPFDTGVGATQGFIFRLQNDSPELLAQVDVGITLESFDDRNGNGFPDVAFHTYSGSRPPIIGMTIYEIRPNNEFVNLTENLNARLVNFVDLDGDGIMELYGTQQLHIPEGVDQDNSKFYDRVPRWFQWNGEAYEPLPLLEGE